MTEGDELRNGETSGALEVEVNAGEAIGVARDADEGGWKRQFAHHGSTLVVHRDVEHNDAVDERTRGHAAQARRRFALGEQEHVVVVAARGGHHGEHKGHQRRRVGVGVHGRGECKDVGAGPGEHPGAGVGPIPQLADRLRDARFGGLGDRALAREGVGDGANRHTGDACHVGDVSHLNSIVVSRRRHNQGVI